MTDLTTEQLDQLVQRKIDEMNGKGTTTSTMIDGRVRLEVNAKKLKTWELVVFQSGNIEHMLFIFCRYLIRGNQLVSPNLPAGKIDKLTDDEIAKIRKSEAYDILSEYTIEQLNQAAQTISVGAEAGF